MTPLAPIRKSQAQAALRKRLAATNSQVDARGYVNTPQENLLPGVDMTQFENDLKEGDGDELRMKFCAAHSSAALAVNTFAPFKTNPVGLHLLGNSGAMELRFEKQLTVVPGRRPANLDVWIRGEHGIVAIESKLLEYFDLKMAKFAPAYAELESLAEENWWSVYQQSIKDPRQHLDRAQLIKHYLGLRRFQHAGTELGPITLLYIFWEPTNWQDVEICKEHRAEVKAFATQVCGSTVAFRWMTYPQLWNDWLAIPSLAEHASNLKNRYEVRL